jgi:hypothetical protein
VEENKDSNRRQHVRGKVPENTVAYLINEANGKKVRTRHKIVDLCPSGVCLETGKLPIRIAAKYHLVVVIYLDRVPNVIKIYHMDAYARHNTNGKTGFFMIRRVKENK